MAVRIGGSPAGGINYGGKNNNCRYCKTCQEKSYSYINNH